MNDLYVPYDLYACFLQRKQSLGTALIVILSREKPYLEMLMSL